jgi:Ni/Co efflux regulator RcnB
MKKLLISAIALGLAAAAPSMVWAAPDDHHDKSAGPKTEAHDAGPKAPKASTAMHARTTSSTSNSYRSHRTSTRTTTKAAAARPALHFKADISTYKRTFQARHQYHAGAYRAPSGYTYQRWGLGERLPSEYFVSSFWLNNFADYDLATPPDGYVWVRYGPDALLIDESDGEVIQVAYGVFD